MHVTLRKQSLFKKDIDDNHDKLMDRINGKSVLVIGGAGSIGSSFIKALLPYKPCSLVVVDINENALAELTRDLRSTSKMYIPTDYRTYPMDYNSAVFKKMFIKQAGFQIVANFSAHKHVRTEKDIYSVEALIENNIIHAKYFLDLLKDFPPELFFCVSTDKAANPVNVMGASKRIMEDLIFSYSDYFPVKTARFANVAFSNGSLPAGFLSRIEKLQPLSGPTDVKRYFVSPVESGQICLLAAILGGNREIFFPKLDEAQMMSFDKIGENLLKEQGYEVLYCVNDQEAILEAEKLKVGSLNYPVHFSVSDTSGEKAFEEFYTEDESVDFDRFSGLGVITDKENTGFIKTRKIVQRFEKAFERSDLSKNDIIQIICDYLPNFHHIETGKSLDSKM